LAGAQAAFEKSIALPGASRPGDEKDATAEAQEMLAKVKERIAKGGPIRQGQKFNPRED
jgi:hypothetical protein